MQAALALHACREELAASQEREQHNESQREAALQKALDAQQAKRWARLPPAAVWGRLGG